GRFTSTDILWEKFRGVSPYVYANNNPINFLDDDGKATAPPKYYKPSNPFQRFLNWFYGNQHLNEAYDFRQALPKTASIVKTEDGSGYISHTVQIKGEKTVTFTATFVDGNDLSKDFMDVPGPSAIGSVSKSAGKG